MTHGNVSGPGPVSTLSSLPCQIALFLQDDFALCNSLSIELGTVGGYAQDERNSAQREATASPEIAATLFMGMKFPAIAKQLSAQTGQGRGKINKV